MAILVSPETKILIQGITGDFGARHARLSLDYGTQVVAGVTPGKGGQFFEHAGHRVPIFNSVADAMRSTGAKVSAIFVPPPFAADAILECADAGMELAVAITEGIPIRDMVRVKRVIQGNDPPRRPELPRNRDSRIGRRLARWLPHRHRPGLHPQEGPCRVVSRSGTLTYEAVYQLTVRGIGQSTCVGIGGDPVNGTSHLDVIRMFNDDPETDGIIMIGEIGGNAEVEAARWIKANCRKPVAGFIAGVDRPGRTPHGPRRRDRRRSRGHSRREDCRLQGMRRSRWRSPPPTWPTPSCAPRRQKASG